jgi:hypothetical protein
MYLMKHQSRQENIIYLVMWGMLFAAPILSMYVRTLGSSGMEFYWGEIFFIWKKFALFLLLFLVHNILLAPLLVYQHRRKLYVSITIAIVTAFTIYQCTTRPAMPPHAPRPDFPRHELRHEPKDGLRHHEVKRPPMHEVKRPPIFIGEHDIMAVVILILMLGMNLGIKGYFKSRREQQQQKELEKKNLEQQLEYLKYQLNPHFLMNTLNNIHALIDIEPPKAQQAIIQLSKILRYVLYESNSDRVPMNKEVEFMENYVKLMRMRYSDKLTFSVSSPDDGTGILIPPMLFIAFVENAFKHGVSYQASSFINITGKRYKGHRNEDRLLWTCTNSKHAKSDTTKVPQQGGVGINNVRKRLDLIFGNDYSLTINDSDTRFEVTLDIPLG